jgi:hypothetical protein
MKPLQLIQCLMFLLDVSGCVRVKLALHLLAGGMSSAPLPRVLADVEPSRARAALDVFKGLSQLRSQHRPVISGGKSYYLGFLRLGVAAAHRSSAIADFAAMAANSILHEIPNFSWTSMVINVGTISARHVDKNRPNSLSVIVALGDYTGGTFGQGGVNYDIKNKILLFNGAEEHYSTPFEGERISIIFFTHRNWNQKNMDKHGVALAEMGFVLPSLGAPITMDPGVASPQ